MSRAREPERTCVGCRSTGPKSSLVRVARGPDGHARIDETGRAPGRGAYVHRDRSCVEAALGRGSLERALRAGLDEQGAATLRAMIEGNDGT
ncbi:MAG TPA: YlxR family protein [Actinomycetota bacterium]